MFLNLYLHITIGQFTFCFPRETLHVRLACRNRGHLLPFQVAAFSVSFAVRRFLEVLVEKGIC